jgi:hypothetical protein
LRETQAGEPAEQQQQLEAIVDGERERILGELGEEQMLQVALGDHRPELVEVEVGELRPELVQVEVGELRPELVQVEVGELRPELVQVGVGDRRQELVVKGGGEQVKGGGVQVQVQTIIGELILVKRLGVRHQGLVLVLVAGALMEIGNK